MTDLARQRCEACTRDTPALTASEVAALHAQLAAGWDVEEGSRLVRRIRCRDFASAFAHAAMVAAIAEAEGHHPDLHIGWGRLDIELTTHAIGGLSRNDFIVAAKIDAIQPQGRQE